MPPSPPGAATSRARRRPSPSVSVVVPVRDAAGLAPMLRALPPVDEVIVVTAGGRYADAAVRASCPSARLVRQTRTGIGNALACGIAASSSEVVVTLDGAGATDPAELPRYVEALINGADVAFGSRYLAGGRDMGAGRWRRLADLLLISVVNVMFGVRRTDPGFGFTAFRRTAIGRLGLADLGRGGPTVWGDGPEFAALLTVRAAARGLAVTEVAGVAYPRLSGGSRAERTTVLHWLRTMATEYAGRTPGPARHSASGAAATDRTGLAPSRTRPAGVAWISAADARTAGTPAPNTSIRPVPAAGRSPAGGSHAETRSVTGEPAWGQPRRRSAPGQDPWASGPASALQVTARHASAGTGRDVKPADDGMRRSDVRPDQQGGPARRNTVEFWPAPRSRRSRPEWTAEGGSGRARSTGDRSTRGGSTGGRSTGEWSGAGRSVGARPTDGWSGGRHEASGRGERTGQDRSWRDVGAQARGSEYQQQRPDLRVINGEGMDAGRTRGGGLHPVPRENLGG